MGQSNKEVFEDPLFLNIFKQMESVENSESFEEYSVQFNKHLEIFSFSVGEDEYATIFKDISQRELFFKEERGIGKGNNIPPKTNPA